ncbi:DNA polymerase IV [uncultured Georgenia sp.]|uniref:DNA polymerase IV n=1 Tax=uncultured Georgenia sp. TaxID=378209 RepID=UPI002639E9E2|nr:DNA polymerase IV [uncultured Georgenia sp.]HLV02959.1 DNA polymerase IV [Actinomycetaceae bacterium]
MSRGERSASARRDWGTDDAGCTILHVDMDAFFAAVELLDRPELVGRPVIVGADRRGVVLSATYEARRFGVHSAMPMARARALCPQAVVLPPHHDAYARMSRRVMAILADVTPVMEKVSIDEAFLDVAGAQRRLGPPLVIARDIRRRIRSVLGVPASVGVAATKFVAKLASSHAKPDGLLLVPRAATVPFLHSLPVGALWGVGEKTRERLHRYGIDTVAALAAQPVGTLHRILGVAAGQRLHDLANGLDPRAVEPERVEKSVGTETTFASDVQDRDSLEAVLLDQAHRTAARLRRSGRLGRTVAIKVRSADFRTITRSRAVEATDVAHDIFSVARGLLDGVPLPAGGVRLLGVRVEQLQSADEGVQLRLGEGDRRREAESAMDDIRRRFGPAALRPASLLDPAASPRPDAGAGAVGEDLGT